MMVWAPESTRSLMMPCAKTARIFSNPKATSLACFSLPSHYYKMFTADLDPFLLGRTKMRGKTQ